MDVAYFELEKAHRRLGLDSAGPMLRERVELIHGSLTYRDERLSGFDLAIATEVIEHFDPPRLVAFEKSILGSARPKTLLVTTPNREYNVHYTDMKTLRHKDHRFEWSRAEFEAWASGAAERNGYSVRFEGIGPEDSETGAPTQMAVFAR